jgi:fructose-bisphosphate aldolase class II
MEKVMTLVSLKEIYDEANKHCYAVGQFNVSNLEFVQAVLKAAEDVASPVIIAASNDGLDYGGVENLAALVRMGASKSSVPVVLHLDHGKDLDRIRECIAAGFTSVMIDGSYLPLEENIRITQAAAKYAHKHDVTLEAELGRLGGIEDDVQVEDRDAFLTDPEEAERFVRETGCDALAVAVGTRHGAYKFKGEARLDFDRILTLKKLLGIPLVLHGASSVPQDLVHKFRRFSGSMSGAKGLPDEAYRRAIAYGINKINIDTDLRLAFTANLREVLAMNAELFDPRKILGFTREAITTVVKRKMELFGCAGKAGAPLEAETVCSKQS